MAKSVSPKVKKILDFCKKNQNIRLFRCDPLPNLNQKLSINDQRDLWKMFLSSWKKYDHTPIFDIKDLCELVNFTDKKTIKNIVSLSISMYPDQQIPFDGIDLEDDDILNFIQLRPTKSELFLKQHLPNRNSSEKFKEKLLETIFSSTVTISLPKDFMANLSKKLAKMLCDKRPYWVGFFYDKFDEDTIIGYWKQIKERDIDAYGNYHDLPEDLSYNLQVAYIETFNSYKEIHNLDKRIKLSQIDPKSVLYDKKSSIDDCLESILVLLEKENPNSEMIKSLRAPGQEGIEAKINFLFVTLIGEIYYHNPYRQPF